MTPAAGNIPSFGVVATVYMEVALVPHTSRVQGSTQVLLLCKRIGPGTGAGRGEHQPVAALEGGGGAAVLLRGAGLSFGLWMLLGCAAVAWLRPLLPCLISSGEVVTPISIAPSFGGSYIVHSLQSAGRRTRTCWTTTSTPTRTMTMGCGTTTSSGRRRTTRSTPGALRAVLRCAV